MTGLRRRRVKLVNLNNWKVRRSVKWVGPLRGLVWGEIKELNEEVLKTPSVINDDPYGKGE
ncbi:MAG: hypothetical protein PVJ38_05870 [Candidatus Bathyarchaeota archaeon]|jgi:glycine cleavage system H lipoate-binding protein